MPRCNLYMIKVDHGQNCYSCERFEYFTRNYRNQRFVEQRRRIEYGDNVNNGHDSNLYENRNLIVLN